MVVITCNERDIMDVKWIISPYQPGDETQIKDLQKLIYGEELEPEKESLDFWKWEFLENPFGEAFINIAKVDKKVVGHYAVVPLEYKLINKMVKVGLVVDVMTHPHYQRQGMFVSLGKSSMNWIRNNGYAFSTGYPYKENVMPGHKKVGWKEIFDLDIHIIPINTENISRVYSNNLIKQKALNLGLKIFKIIKKYKYSSGSEVKIEKQDKFPINIENLINKINEDFSFTQNRTLTFLKWRYELIPNRKYEKYFIYEKNVLSGYVIVREMKLFNLSTLFIVDILAINDYLFKKLLDHVYSLYNKSSVDLIAYAVSPNTRIKSILRKKRFLKSNYKFHLISYDCGNYLQIMKNNINKSYITSHDFDVI